jgi:hypothetical protein
MSKRKWDQPASETSDNPAKISKIDDGSDFKVSNNNSNSNEAAVAAAVIAAKIAAQFGGSNVEGSLIAGRDPHDAEFVQDMDINDVRNRYLLTRGSTQTQVSHFSIYRRIAILFQC